MQLAALACLWLFFAAAPSQAQLVKLNIGYSAISGDALPAWIAKDAGIFEKNGLDVQLVFFTGGTTAVMALVSADTPIAQLAGPAVVNSVLAGSDATLIVGGVTSLNYYLLARPEIKTAEQLKGGTVAISRFGSASDFIARYAPVEDRAHSRQGRHHRANRQHDGAGGCDPDGPGPRHRGESSRQHHRAKARHECPGRST